MSHSSFDSRVFYVPDDAETVSQKIRQLMKDNKEAIEDSKNRLQPMASSTVSNDSLATHLP